MLQVLLPDLSLSFSLSLSLSLSFAAFTEFACIPPCTIMCDDVSLNSHTPTSCFFKGAGRTMGQYRWSRRPSKAEQGWHGAPHGLPWLGGAAAEEGPWGGLCGDLVEKCLEL